MRTDRLLAGLVAWVVSLLVLAGTWAYALRTADPRGTVTVPLWHVGVGFALAAALFVAGIVLLVRAGGPRKPSAHRAPARRRGPSDTP